jgi:hypothetical protein
VGMYGVSYVSSNARHHLKTRTVVGWKAGVGARLRAEAEVGSVIGRVWMVETAHKSQWMEPKDAKRLCTTYHDYNISNVRGKMSYRIDNKKGKGRLKRKLGC